MYISTTWSSVRGWAQKIKGTSTQFVWSCIYTGKHVDAVYGVISLVLAYNFPK